VGQDSILDELIQNPRAVLSEGISEEADGRRDRLSARADQPELGRSGFELGHHADDLSGKQICRHIEAGLDRKALAGDTINAENLRMAHEEIETGKDIGKIVLEGFWAFWEVEMEYEGTVYRPWLNRNNIHFSGAWCRNPATLAMKKENFPAVNNDLDAVVLTKNAGISGGTSRLFGSATAQEVGAGRCQLVLDLGLVAFPRVREGY
jgi:hypothetical protein